MVWGMKWQTGRRGVCNLLHSRGEIVKPAVSDAEKCLERMKGAGNDFSLSSRLPLETADVQPLLPYRTSSCIWFKLSGFISSGNIENVPDGPRDHLNP